MSHIQILPPETARLIAAGEVIDRPAAALRELLDNALDSGASEIGVEILGGGIVSIRVVDDGSGMGAEDLERAILPHATSKIRTADDLLTARSLGFRGEALSSIAAAARLEITSRDEDSRVARRLLCLPGLPPSVEAKAGRRGTSVSVQGLFDNFPARRRFLKRPQAEGALCRQVFMDKALAHPRVTLRWSSDGRASETFPSVAAIADRVQVLYEGPPGDLVHSLGFSGEGFEGTIVFAGPSYYRSDRRFMQVFVNRRRIQDFGLLSGLDWSFENLLPGGAHPWAFLFIEIDPALADFNIHPAKREVRFRDPAGLRHVLSHSLRDYLDKLVKIHPESALPETERFISGNLFAGEAEFAGGYGGDGGGGESSRSHELRGGNFAAMSQSAGGGLAYRSEPDAWGPLLRERPFSRRDGTGSSETNGPSDGMRYLGIALGLFLVAEKAGILYLIDQHAAHERLIFDELVAKPQPEQELLVPLVHEPETDAEDLRLREFAPVVVEAGFRLERETDGTWLLTSLPAALSGDPEGALRELLADLGDDPLRSVRAMIACKAAVKDGDVLEPAAAEELARRALLLPEPRCPHGRPVWVRLSRDELFRLVRRIV